MHPRPPVLAFAALLVIYALGSVLDIMEVDAAQYATMAREMAMGADPLHLKFRGQDYLDKPPLLFWMSALSFKLLGVHNWSYKLPSILFALLGLWSTFRLAKLYYGREVGVNASLMLGSSLAMVLMTNDVRCDTMLMGCVITATWCGAEYLERARWSWLLGASLAIGAGMLTKGPMGLMAPLLALGGHVLLKRKWSVLRDPRLLSAPVLICIVLLPMCMGLYEQFGAHGLRFFFWEQSFGRLTGENVWKDDSTPLFFTHEVLWQLLPWTLFVLGGLILDLRLLFSARRGEAKEWIALAGITLVFTALSFSHFKLPHYLYVIHPLFCIQAAKAVPRMSSRSWSGAQFAFVAILMLGGATLMLWSFPSVGWSLVALVLCVALVVHASRSTGVTRIIGTTFWAMCGLALLLDLHFYPALLPYQANAEAGKWVRARGVTEDRFFAVGAGGTALDHYSRLDVRYAGAVWEMSQQVRPGTVLFTDSTGRADLLSLGLVPLRETIFPEFKVQLLTWGFLDPDLRSKEVSTRYILEY
ncbi:MAG: glycosyltransferase family 39 protein [Flavobacteriales bacterium]|nr:glycosyltransferase family 39 protein [Flavobacteriales bacterium]